MDIRGAEPRETLGRTLLQLLVFEVAYYLAYRSSMSFHTATSAPLWLPDAILLSALLLTPRRKWWLFLLAPIPVRLFVEVSPGVPYLLLAISFVNDSLKALLGAYILTRLNNGTPKLGTIRELFQFFLIVVVLTPFLSATGGAFTRYYLFGDSFQVAWQVWFLGNALPNLILTPMILYWSNVGTSEFRSADKWRWLEGGLLFGTLLLLGLLESSDFDGDLSSSPILMYLPFPLLLYAAARFGPAGVSSAFFIVAAFAISSAEKGQGPFAGHPPDSHILWIQLVFYATSIPLLGVAVLLRESNRNERIARENHKQMQELAGRLIHLQDEERRRIARELHDSFGQTLALMRLRLETLIKNSDEKGVEPDELAEVSALVASANEDLHVMAHNYPIYELDRLGLAHAIQSVIHRLADSPPVEIWTDLEPVNDVLSPAEATNLFRIVQEGLSNIIKHSNALHASVRLSFADGDVRLVIEDDGDGIELPAKVHDSGVGLSNIAERVRMIGGTLSVDSAPGKGTRITVKLTPAEKVNDPAESTQSPTVLSTLAV